MVYVENGVYATKVICTNINCLATYAKILIEFTLDPYSYPEIPNKYYFHCLKPQF